MNNAATIGTISHGTMRPEDLIPAFCAELRLRLEGLRPIPGTIGDRAGTMTLLREIETDAEDGANNYFCSEACRWALEFLFDSLDAYAPEGYYFGANEGDGSDYGFWAIESDD